MRLPDSAIGRRAALLVVSVLLLAGNLGFYVWFRGTTQERERALESRRRELEQSKNAAESEAARVSGQRDRLSQVTTAISDFYGKRVGPSRETLAPLVDELHTVFRKVGVSPAQISYSTAPVKDLPLTEMKIDFTFKNDYGKLKQLLAALEADRRWIVVRQLSVGRDPDVPGSVQVHMDLATYFAGQAPEAAALSRSAAR